jgi:histidyl-tRNA synthetase
LKDWQIILDLLTAMGIADYVEIDLGIVRGLAYYTGFVFEVFETTGLSRALAGGGRYDDLVEKMGGPALPAVGFAIGDVVLTDLLKQKQLLPAYNNAPDLYVVFTGEAEKTVALGDVQDLRAAGIHTEYALNTLGLSKQMKLADQSSAKGLLIYGETELALNQVRYRHLATREEILLDRGTLIQDLLIKVPQQ